MAKMIDKKPSWKGEGKVWESLSTNLPGDNVVYNQREVNGREYDFCVLAENLGLVIIEVKGWDSDKIDVRGVDNIIVEGYDEPQTSPKKQARAYRFAILNKIVEKYNVSPLVLDMVCYPFITQEQYIKTKLDIVSEPEYTIFKEDIEDGEKLNEKIQHLFTRNKFIPHADFSSDLLVRIRKQLEPEFELSVVDDQNKPYSKISIFPNDINENIIQTIIGDYFDGVKQIVFVREQTDFALFLEFLNDSFKLHNIDFKKNNLKVGYEDGIKVSKYKDVFSTFNISIYCIQNLQTIISEELVVVDGQCDEKQHELLATLSNITSFNVQQYDIEHATTDRDILVEAGAGTGKTYSMVSRIAFLCNKQDEPVMNIADEVAMVTFTNDAAINMKKRLKQMFVNYFVLTGYERYLKYVEDIDRANISTIHKFAINILRGESLYTGLGTNFKISSNEYERGKAYDLFLSEFLEKKEEENTNFSNELPIPVYDLKKKLMNIADRLFDKSINLETIKSSEMGTVVENNIPFLNDLLLEVMFPAEAIYTETMRNSNDIDLRECLIELEKILSNGCEKLEDLKIRYLFIDEFQDTDDVQIEVFQKLQKSINTKCRLFVVGDLKQSIYRFRGAKLNAFQKLQNGKKVDWCHYRLNRNYRTDGRLLELFDSVFSGMGAEGILPYKPGEDQLLSDVLTDRNENDLFTELPCHGKDNDKILDLLNDTILEEKSKIEEMYKEKELSKEERTIAILVRSNWQVDNIVSAASKKDINIEISTGGDLFQLPSTLDLYKLVLALSHNTNTVYLINFIESNYINLKLDYQRLKDLSDDDKLNELIGILNEFFTQRMSMTWKELLEEVYSQPILFALKRIFDALQPWENYSMVRDRQRLYIANYDYLLERMIKFSRIDALTLNQIIEYLGINILTGQKQLSRTLDSKEDGVHVICTTIHKSKGLEYGTVILPYTYEDISDTKKVKLEASYNDSKLAYTVLFDNGIRERNSNYNEVTEVDEQISEEARILYVALTRTIRHCIWINNIDSTSSISWATLLEG